MAAPAPAPAAHAAARHPPFAAVQEASPEVLQLLKESVLPYEYIEGQDYQLRCLNALDEAFIKIEKALTESANGQPWCHLLWWNKVHARVCVEPVKDRSVLCAFHACKARDVDEYLLLSPVTKWVTVTPTQVEPEFEFITEWTPLEHPCDNCQSSFHDPDTSECYIWHGYHSEHYEIADLAHGEIAEAYFKAIRASGQEPPGFSWRLDDIFLFAIGAPSRAHDADAAYDAIAKKVAHLDSCKL